MPKKKVIAARNLQDWTKFTTHINDQTKKIRSTFLNATFLSFPEACKKEMHENLRDLSSERRIVIYRPLASFHASLYHGVLAVLFLRHALLETLTHAFKALHACFLSYSLASPYLISTPLLFSLTLLDEK
jgi:hypothetical protein